METEAKLELLLCDLRHLLSFSLRTVRQKPVTSPRLVKEKKGNKRDDGSEHVEFKHNEDWTSILVRGQNRDKRDEKDRKC